MRKKIRFFSFINKSLIALLLSVLLAIILACTYFMVAYWSEMPILIKIIGPILVTIIFIGIIVALLNGMIITKHGTILFVPDFRFKKLKEKDLERIAIIFNEWENGKYSVMTKFVYKDGRIFVKDYSKQFRNMNNKELAMSLYTIPKRKLNNICDNLLDLSTYAITIIDKNGNIVKGEK